MKNTQLIFDTHPLGSKLSLGIFHELDGAYSIRWHSNGEPSPQSIKTFLNLDLITLYFHAFVDGWETRGLTFGN